MPAVLSNWAANSAWTALMTGDRYLALHDDDPTVAGLTSTEVAGGDYARQLIVFSAAANRGVISTNPQVFTGLPATTLYYLAVWTAAAGGFMIATAQLAAPTDVPASGQYVLAAGDLAFTL